MAPIDLDDPKAGKSADRLYRMLGANPAAAYSIANRTGRIPPSVAAEMNGSVASNDPARLMPTIELATRLAKDHPDALTMVQGGDDIRNTATQYWHSIAYGATPEQAARRIIEMRSPEYQDAWNARRKNIDIDAEVVKAISVRDLNGMFGVDPAATAAMLSAYPELVKERFAATGDMPLAKAQAREQLRPFTTEADANDDDGDGEGSGSGFGGTQKPSQKAPTLSERARLNAAHSFYRGTLIGAAQLEWLAKVTKAIERGLKGEELLNELLPGLKNVRWKERREEELRKLESAPERYRKILEDLEAYDQMAGSSSVAEFATAAGAQIAAGMLSPESWVGWSVKGATWGIRALKAAAQQGAISGVIDLGVQDTLVRAGVQSEIDLGQTAGAVIGGAVVGGGVHASGEALNGRLGMTPGGPPKQPAPTPEGASKQEQPLGVRGEEPAAPAPEMPPSKETPPTQAHIGESNGPKVSPATTESRQVIDLTKHEDGGRHHPLSKHSGMPFEFLDNRLKTENGITAASTFHNDAEANMSVQLLLDHYPDEVKKLISHPKEGKTRHFEARLADIGAEHPSVGLVLERGASTLKPGNGVRIWIRKDRGMPEGFRVITAHPILLHK